MGGDDEIPVYFVRVLNQLEREKDRQWPARTVSGDEVKLRSRAGDGVTEGRPQPVAIYFRCRQPRSILEMLSYQVVCGEICGVERGQVDVSDRAVEI
jgi:hypothetical protein